MYVNTFKSILRPYCFLRKTSNLFETKKKVLILLKNLIEANYETKSSVKS